MKNYFKNYLDKHGKRLYEKMTPRYILAVVLIILIQLIANMFGLGHGIVIHP